MRKPTLLLRVVAASCLSVVVLAGCSDGDAEPSDDPAGQVTDENEPDETDNETDEVEPDDGGGENENEPDESDNGS